VALAQVPPNGLANNGAAWSPRGSRGDGAFSFRVTDRWLRVRLSLPEPRRDLASESVSSATVVRSNKPMLDGARSPGYNAQAQLPAPGDRRGERVAKELLEGCAGEDDSKVLGDEAGHVLFQRQA